MGDNPPKGLSLPQRRAIACVGIIVFLFVYVVAITSLAGVLHGGKITALIFYALAGTLWGVPIIPLISWSENYKGKKKSK
ncbi:DUF2842 domain-containing protein [Asticcacaulis sp. 201]|uniref:DUF2842 domain-containing protein n=1 Tax=Asticcacaulis sp. 201 TaxID=3028787 RepID=UPI002916316C|nr:DUF2842 domain-containing protein [Asticcacaulis sp. 201]MDV6329294.1 DUF2842 domain-containing protein [Asticcacaulis sp. 201]